MSAIDEAIRVGERAGAQIQISHLLPRKTDEREDHRSLELIDQARGRGLDIAFDMHTRLYGTTFLNTIVPLWAQDDLARHLRSPESRRKMREYKSIVAGGGWERWGRAGGARGGRVSQRWRRLRGCSRDNPAGLQRCRWCRAGRDVIEVVTESERECE